MNLNSTDHGCQSVDDTSSSLDKFNPDGEDNLLEDVANQVIGSLFPDDEDDLLAGIMDGFDVHGLPNQVDDLEDYDFFGSGGGMELESDPQESLIKGFSNINLSEGGGNGAAHYGFPNGVGTVAGEHPYGEHPSRTLFVRNINSNVEDSELRTLFEVIHGSWISLELVLVIIVFTLHTTIYLCLVDLSFFFTHSCFFGYI